MLKSLAKAVRDLCTLTGAPKGLPNVALLAIGLVDPLTGALTHYNSPTGGGLAEVAGSGFGGAVTQITSNATLVTLSKRKGRITTVSLALAAAAEATFTVTNTVVAAIDIVALSTNYAGNGTVELVARKVLDGSFTVTVKNVHASAALNAVVNVNFVIHKGAIS